MKTLAIILHYNTVKMTEDLYEMLKPYERDNYDLTVLDNGSDIGKSTKYFELSSGENAGYGGGLDMAMEYFLGTDYDSFMLLNSDLIVHGYNFIKELRRVLFSEEDLVVITPCVIQPTKEQGFWKQMHNWGHTKIRYVPFVDYQCPLMKRKFVEKVKAFGSHYGWVQDIMTGIICEDNKWKIGVVDWVNVVHLGNMTVKTNPHLSDYNIKAQQEMDRYFIEKNLVDRMNELKLKSLEYKV
jgi:GT2 family glycosyltransferase